MEKIKQFRELLGISQEELAEKSGISRVTISKLESGAQTITTNATIEKLAKALNKKPQDFFNTNVN